MTKISSASFFGMTLKRQSEALCFKLMHLKHFSSFTGPSSNGAFVFAYDEMGKIEVKRSRRRIMGGGRFLTIAS